MKGLLGLGARAYGLAWEARRRLYASGLLQQRRVPARVVSVGNLTVGGTGKTTLVLHLALRARAAGLRVAVVNRRYRPGPSGVGDEELLFREALGDDAVFAGRSKWQLAQQASDAGFDLVIVDDGFSHWALARDLDLVLVDAQDPWGGGALLPAGRLREPRRALQRADVLIATRLGPSEPPEGPVSSMRPYAPAALTAAGRHRVAGVRLLENAMRSKTGGAAAGAVAEPGQRVWIVTGTGNPRAVRRTAEEAGMEVAGCHAYRDHHWFRGAQAWVELERAARRNARVLLTAKDAVRWPPALRHGVLVLDVVWEWVQGGDEVERRVLGLESGSLRAESA